MVVHRHNLGEVVNKCTSYNLDCLPSLCQKLSELVKIGRSYDKNNFACFWDTVYFTVHTSHSL